MKTALVIVAVLILWPSLPYKLHHSLFNGEPAGYEYTGCKVPDPTYCQMVTKVSRKDAKDVTRALLAGIEKPYVVVSSTAGGAVRLTPEDARYFAHWLIGLAAYVEKHAEESDG